MATSPIYSGVTWTTSELLTEVKAEASLPSSASITDAEILAWADQAIRSIQSEPIINTIGFAGRTLDYQDTLVTDGLRSYSEFLVPNSAASGTVSHVDYYKTDSDEPRHLYPTTAYEAHEYDTSSGTGTPTHWYFRDGRVVLVPRPTSPDATARVRIHFPRAHPKLVESTVVGTVSSVDQATNVITLSATHPTGWPAAPYAVDLYSAYSPHSPLLSRLVISSDSGADLTYTAPIVGEEDLGSAGSATYVALAGQSDCIQLPDSMRKSLTSRVASYLLRSIGDEEAANSLWQTSGVDLESVASQMTPRTKGPGRVYVHHGSRFRRGRYTRRSRY